MRQFDVLVIGGGPGGYTAAIAAAKAGKKTALFEAGNVGGTCLNVGCIPTKYLVDKAAVLERIRALAGQDILRDPGSFSFRKIHEGKEEVVKKLVNGVSFLLKKNGVEVIHGEAKLEKGKTVVCGDETFKGKAVIIATGSETLRIPIPGADLCLDSTDLLALEKRPASMTVIGGGVIGLEFASAFASFGTEVTVIEMLPSLLPNAQKEAADLVTKGLKKRGVKILTGAKVLEVKKDGASCTTFYELDGSKESVSSEIVLMAIGRKARLTGIDAAKLGLKLSKKGCVEVDAHQKTNLSGVYAIGDAAGGLQLAHAAFCEAEKAVADITKKAFSDSGVIPSCVYTQPCYASVGMTEKQAAEAGFDPVKGSFQYSANGMALAEGAEGCVYVIMDRKTKTTLGVHIVGENASEMIGMGLEAVEKHQTLQEWKEMTVAHPSLCEMIREAALDAFGEAIHKI